MKSGHMAWLIQITILFVFRWSVGTWMYIRRCFILFFIRSVHAFQEVLVSGLELSPIFFIMELQRYWGIASVYLHSCMIVENRQNFRKLAAILLVTFLGFFTQYYFAIIGAFLSLGYTVWLMFNKYWKRLLFIS